MVPPGTVSSMHSQASPSRQNGRERARRIAVDQLPAAGQREIAVDPGLGHDRRERVEAVLDAVQRAGGRALEHDAAGPSAGAGAQRRRLEDDDARTASREMIRRQTAR